MRRFKTIGGGSYLCIAHRGTPFLGSMSCLGLSQSGENESDNISFRGDAVTQPLFIHTNAQAKPRLQKMHTHTHTPAPSGLASGVAQPLGMSIKGTMTTFLDSLKASPPAIFAVLPRACGGRDGSPVTHNHSKKPFYVYFRILHAYTIIYLKYRVYC